MQHNHHLFWTEHSIENKRSYVFWTGAETQSGLVRWPRPRIDSERNKKIKIKHNRPPGGVLMQTHPFFFSPSFSSFSLTLCLSIPLSDFPQSSGQTDCQSAPCADKLAQVFLWYTVPHPNTSDRNLYNADRSLSVSQAKPNTNTHTHY